PPVVERSKRALVARGHARQEPAVVVGARRRVPSRRRALGDRPRRMHHGLRPPAPLRIHRGECSAASKAPPRGMNPNPRLVSYPGRTSTIGTRHEDTDENPWNGARGAGHGEHAERRGLARASGNGRDTNLSFSPRYSRRPRRRGCRLDQRRRDRAHRHVGFRRAHAPHDERHAANARRDVRGAIRRSRRLSLLLPTPRLHARCRSRHHHRRITMSTRISRRLVLVGALFAGAAFARPASLAARTGTTSIHRAATLPARELRTILNTLLQEHVYLA